MAGTQRVKAQEHGLLEQRLVCGHVFMTARITKLPTYKTLPYPKHMMHQSIATEFVKMWVARSQTQVWYKMLEDVAIALAGYCLHSAKPAWGVYHSTQQKHANP